MSLAYWRDICMTNCPEIDDGHTVLLNILEAIYQDIQQEGTRSRIQAKLHYLFDTVLSHCETEERLMERYSYPDSKAHTDHHEELLNNVLNLRLKAEEQDQKLTLDMIHGIATWLGQHAWDYDLELVKFIQYRQQQESLLFS